MYEEETHVKQIITLYYTCTLFMFILHVLVGHGVLFWGRGHPFFPLLRFSRIEGGSTSSVNTVF